MNDIKAPMNTPNIADLLGGAFAGHTMQRVRTPDGRYRYSYVSPGVEDSFGLDPDALMAMDDVDHRWVHPEDRERFLSALERSATHLQRLDVEVRIENGSSGHKWVRSIGNPKRLEDGTVIWDGVALDVTDRYEALDALNKTLSQVRANEASEARFSYIAATDVSESLNALKSAIADLPDASVEAQLVKARFDDLMRTMSAARGLMNQPSQEFQSKAVQPADVQALTDKQRAVLTRLSSGESNRIIAEGLGITEGTVKLHISSILKRLGVKNRTEAALKWAAIADMAVAR
jgi:DNA-binding NarL/FixJ family response regulator